MFDDLFKRELTALEPPPEIRPHPEGTDPRAQLLCRGEDILTLLETYAADLENPCKTLKQMAPLVDTIENQVHLFEKKAQDRFSEDEALLEWVDELSLTAKIATLKFHRGDFL